MATGRWSGWRNPLEMCGFGGAAQMSWAEMSADSGGVVFNDLGGDGVRQEDGG
jgi:hypothetical protein